MRKLYYIAIVALLFTACNNSNKTAENIEQQATKQETGIAERLALWKEVTLNSGVEQLSENQKQVLKYLIKASQKIDDIFWQQTYPFSRDSLYSTLKDSTERLYVDLNYGPWDRTNENESFIKGIGRRPLGGNFYPTDMKYLPFMAYELPDKLSPLTVIRRDSNKHFVAIPYHIFYQKDLSIAADYLNKAADLCNNESFKKYLTAEANALLSDNYEQSEIAWLQTNGNLIDFVAEPVETDNDDFLGIKKSYEAYVLVKDTIRTKQSEVYSKYIKKMQECIPCDDVYKKNPKTDKINIVVYNALYYAGYSNCSGKNISINLPNNTEVLKQYGSRKLMFYNTMSAKYESILKPISKLMIDESQADNFNSDIFFESNLLYEIGDKLGFDKTLSGEPVVDKLKDKAVLIDKIRADLVRIYLVPQMQEEGIISKENTEKHYVCYLSNLFRIARFGDAIPQSKANIIIINYLLKHKAVSRTKNGKYLIAYGYINKVINDFTAEIHRIQEEGNYNKAQELIDKYLIIDKKLQNDLDKINNNDIPIDIRFKQGLKVLGV